MTKINWFCKFCKKKIEHNLYVDSYLWRFNIIINLYGKCNGCGECNINKTKELDLEDILNE